MGGMMGGMMGGGTQARRSRKSQAEIEQEQKKETEQQEAGDGRQARRPRRRPPPRTSRRRPRPADKAASHARRSPRGCAGSRSPACSTTPRCWPTTARPSRTPRSPIRTTRGSTSSGRPLRPDGTWSDWEDVDAEENLKVLDNLPEEDEELTPETVRPDNLVDPLPFLKAGLWEKVHIASLVPKEKKKVASRRQHGHDGRR